MVLRVTFDTNVLDWACRPERFPKDPLQPLMYQVNAALRNGGIKGFYSVTMLTIEGIKRCDRAEVFANTRITSESEAAYTIKNADLPDAVRKIVGSGDLETIPLTLRVEQPSRKPLHPEVASRMKAAREMGVRVLGDVPRTGAFHLTDPDGKHFLERGDGAELQEWTDKIHQVAREIEDRGVGFGQVKALGEKMGASNPTTTWFRALDQASDIHQERAVERAFSEWADGDSVAAHIAYGLDVFCSRDNGKTGSTSSVLDPENRKWLTSTYGVQFMNFEELAANLPK